MNLVLINLIISICTVETGLTNVINKHDGNSSSIGLCQVKLETAKRFDKRVTVKKLMNKDYNIKMAYKYFMHQFLRYGNVRQAISSYNHGSFTNKNKNYVDKVLQVYDNNGLIYSY